MKHISILVADDHSVVRYGLCSILNSVENFKVVAEAQNGSETIALYKEHRPDVCFIDITMPDLNGIETCRNIKKMYPNARIIIMTIHLSEDYLNEVLSAGASGYMLKNAGKQEIIDNIGKVMNGEKVFSKAVSDLMAESFLKKHEAPEQRPVAEALTKREKEILKLIIEGKTNQAIGEQLFISPRTVETHRANLMHKLGVKNTAALVRKAIKHDLFK